MGRPRKRQFIETIRDDPEADPIIDALDLGPLPFNIDDYDYNDNALAQPYYTNQETIQFFNETTRTVGEDNSGDIWRFGDPQLIGRNPIDFDSLGFDNTKLPEPSSEASLLLAETTESSSSESGNSHAHIPAPAVPCSCLAGMYLALASLQQFPTDIISALRTVRTAAATAAGCIWCPQCGSVVVDQVQPGIDGFQNIMLLGTLLPIIAHGYQKLIYLIDQEADAAVATGRTKTFEFQEYGGLCLNQTTIQGEMACIEKEIMFTPVEMAPMQWRTTVRALLRVDIYGHDTPSYNYKGLKGLVEEIEQRQKARHDWLDTLPEDVREVSLGVFGPQQRMCLGEQTHGCLQILEMAKLALNNLVIA
jgi:hypothetical protein